MAEEVQIVGTQSTAKIRNPLAYYGLSIITFGIYGIFWYYYINREMADYGRARGTTELGENPTNSVLAVTLGVFACGVPALISMWNTCQRVEKTARYAGDPDPMQGVILFILNFVIVGPYMMQDTLNKAWQAQAAGGGGQLPPQQAQPPMPQQQAAEQPAAQPPAPEAPPPPPQQGGQPPPA